MSKRANISQIEKYLNGKLDATAMHQLEREAQGDPFLMDALEGYDKSGVNHQQLTDLQQRLQARLSKKQSRIIPWRMLAIAASVLIALTIGGLWVYNSSPKKQLLTAQADKALVKPSPLTEVPAIDEKQKESVEKFEPPVVITPPQHPLIKRRIIPGYAANNATTGNADEIMAPAPKASEAAKPVAADSTPLDEALVMDYAAQKKNTIVKAEHTDSARAVTMTGRANIHTLKEVNIQNSIRGKVLDVSGEPLVGVTVKIKNTQKDIITDSNGNFSFNTDSSQNAKLVVSYIGYETLELIASANKPVTIKLQPDNAALSEVVVVGYGTVKRSYTKAHPQNGNASYEKYINDKAVAENGKTGTVKIAFTVNTNGGLSDFKIINGLSDAANKTAIDIIKNGPRWIGNINGKPETVTVKIKFHKAD